MVLTQCGILNRDSPDVEENRGPFATQRTERTEIHLGRDKTFGGGGGGGVGNHLHYLATPLIFKNG